MRKIWIVCLVVLLGLCACRPRHAVLRIGIISPSIDHLPLSYALAEGGMDSDDLMIIPFTSGWEAQEALIAGRIDTAILPFTYIWNAVAKGYPIKTASFFERETDGLLTHPAIQSVSDLQDKKIGMLKASSLEVLWLDFAKSNGIKAQTVYFHSPNELVTAFIRSEVDAAVLYVPLLNKLEGDFKVLHWFAERYPLHPCCDLAVNTKTLAAGKQKRFQRFFAELDRFVSGLNTREPRFMQFAARTYSLSPDQLQEALQHTRFRLGLEQQGVVFQQKMAEYSKVQGYLERIPAAEEVFMNISEP